MNYFSSDNEVVSELIYGKQENIDVDLSIVIPTYRRIGFLRKTICSINRQRITGRISYEVIIVSNDPEYKIDDIVDLLNVNRYKVYRNANNIGMVGNMNRCAILAQGKYISYVQDDDILLDDYFESVENLFDSGKLKNIDCLIPNRYYYYDMGNRDSIFGEQSYKKEKKKELLRKMISVGNPTEEFQKVAIQDCAETWFNCFGGGPTCGMLFKRESLLKTEGFSKEYPYAFDFVFFMDFSNEYNVVLYNKYLAVYRMTDSASNRPAVQNDFFRSDMRLLERTENTNAFVSFFKDEIIRFSIENKSSDTQKIIEPIPHTNNNMKYMFFRVIRFWNLMRSNVYRRKLLPQELLSKI